VAELVILVGLQGAGKTTYYQQYLAATHVHVSKDLMGHTRNRVQKQGVIISAALAEGKSVVVDNTSLTPAVRAPLIALGKQHGARVVACFFEIPVKTAVERNRQREGKARVADVVIYVAARKIKAPTFHEGFDEVRIIGDSLPLFAGGETI
jgi:predicted kinase